MFYRSVNTINCLVLGGVSVLGFINVADIDFNNPYVFSFGIASLAFIGMCIASLYDNIKNLKTDMRIDREYYTLEEVKKELSERIANVERSSDKIFK